MQQTLARKCGFIAANVASIMPWRNIAQLPRIIGMTSILLLAVVRATQVHADSDLQGGAAAWMPEADATIQPTAAWTEFCKHLPTECKVDLTEPEVIELTPATWADIVSVNTAVNRSIRGVTDQEQWGVEDRWDYPDDGKGDCEDIQLLKRKVLAVRGLPRRAMRMTVVIDQEGAGHAVLMVRTIWGDLILDNKRDDVLPLRRTGYIFVKREGAHGSQWVSLGRQADSVMTANQ